MLDETSMVAKEPMRQPVGIANVLGAERLLLVGDRWQIQPIDADKAYCLIRSNGIALARMEFAQTAAARHIRPQRSDNGDHVGESGIGAARSAASIAHRRPKSGR